MGGFVLVTDKHRLLGQDCRRCNRKIRAGQVVLGYRLSGLPPGQRDFTIHKRCIEQMLAAAPAEEFAWDGGEDFDTLRQRILATGQAFPA